MPKTTGDPFGDAKNEPPDGAQDEDTGIASQGLLAGLVKSRTDRFKGAEAASIGLVLAGCVGLGFFIGQWLDAKFGTTFWMPVGLLAGVAAGFRELFHTIKRLNAQTARQAADRKRQIVGATTSAGEEFRRPKGAALEKEVPENAEVEVGSARMFSVPAPPAASFETPRGGATRTAPPAKVRTESLEELTQRLLNEEKDDLSQ